MPCIKLLPCHTRWPPQGVLCKGGSHIADKDHKHEVTEVNWCPELDLEHDSYSWGNTKIVNFGIFYKKWDQDTMTRECGSFLLFLSSESQPSYLRHSHRWRGTGSGRSGHIINSHWDTQTPRHWILTYNQRTRYCSASHCCYCSIIYFLNRDITGKQWLSWSQIFIIDI